MDGGCDAGGCGGGVGGVFVMARCAGWCLHCLRPDAEEEVKDALEADAGFLEHDLHDGLFSFHSFVI